MNWQGKCYLHPSFNDNFTTLFSYLFQCGNWIRVRIQRMEPDLYDIGGNAEEARSLNEIHEHLCAKLAVS